jgi:hypothetical protein
MSNIKQFPFTSKLGWSASRYEVFSICKRRYFFQYYAKYDTDIPVRSIQRMKDLVSIPLETGGIVHTVFETLLRRLRKTPEVIDVDRFFEFASGLVQSRISRVEFDEIVYGDQHEITSDDIYPKVRTCLDNFLASDRFEWLTGVAIDAVDEWVIEPPGYGESRLNGLKVYCKVDFLFPVEGYLHIIDWKTGKEIPDKHRKQLLGYATWASYHFEVEPDLVKPKIAYLYPEYVEVHEDFTAEDLDYFAVRVEAETREMYGYCREVEGNIPLDKQEFQPVDREEICRYCNFRGICFPERYPYDFSR